MWPLLIGVKNSGRGSLRHRLVIPVPASVKFMRGLVRRQPEIYSEWNMPKHI